MEQEVRYVTAMSPAPELRDAGVHSTPVHLTSQIIRAAEWSGNWLRNRDAIWIAAIGTTLSPIWAPRLTTAQPPRHPNRRTSSMASSLFNDPHRVMRCCGR